MFDPSIKEENVIISAVLNQWGSFCNICGTKRSIENIKIIRKNPEAIVLHINCASCSNSHFISFNYNSAAFTMQQYSSDLEANELHKLGNSPVNADDLIDTHLALKKVKNSKDLLAILKNK